MNTNDIIVERPSTPNQLVLLFHGVGSNARDLLSLGEALAPHLPDAVIVSVQGPDAAGRGWQWFSVQGVTEADRPGRVAAAMPGFVQAVQRWQEASALTPAQTTLVGFSQGAIMALESTQEGSPPAARVVALSGRFARPPRVAHASVRTHLMHGDADAVMPLQGAVDALAQLQSLGAAVKLDRFPGLGHAIDGRVVDAVVRRLTEPVVRSTWLHFDDEELVVREQTGDGPDAERRLDLGTARIARDFFRHDPPTGQEIERAIDITEDAIMQLGRPADIRGPLLSSSPALRPWAALSSPTMTVELVEQWFQRLASAALGHPAAMHGLPSGREAAATLLLLREFLHHRGHAAIEFIEPHPTLEKSTIRA
jgi:phospholipase/carboxylesterase